MTFLTILFFLLVILDAACTIKLADHEMNPVTLWAMRKFGVVNGAIASILLPALGIVFLCHFFQSPVCLAFFTGMRSLLGLEQIHTLRAVTKG